MVGTDPAITGATTGSVYENSLFSQSWTVTGISNPSSISITGILPAGISSTVNAGSLSLSGAPTESGNFSFRIIASNDFSVYSGNIAVLDYSLTVIPTYTITATADANSIISSVGAITVNYEEDQTFTFSANSGYQITKVLIDGVNDPTAVSNGIYTFLDVRANHTIAVIASAVLVKVSTAIITQPTGASICKGSDYTLIVEAEGTGLQYQWYKGGEKLQGATDSEYTVTNATDADYAEYRVVVTGSDGITLSSDLARLWVADPLPADLHFAEYPQLAETGRSYTLQLAGYIDVTHYAWSYSGAGATFIPGSGQSNKTSVKFSGEAVGSGMITATLTHVCGERTVSQAITIQYPTGIDPLDNNFKVSPSPTSGIVKLSGTLQSANSIRVYSLTGKLMKIYDAQDGETTIDLSGYAQGMYLVQYNNKTTKVIRQ